MLYGANKMCAVVCYVMVCYMTLHYGTLHQFSSSYEIPLFGVTSMVFERNDTWSVRGDA